MTAGFVDAPGVGEVADLAFHDAAMCSMAPKRIKRWRRPSQLATVRPAGDGVGCQVDAETGLAIAIGAAHRGTWCAYRGPALPAHLGDPVGVCRITTPQTLSALSRLCESLPQSARYWRQTVYEAPGDRRRQRCSWPPAAASPVSPGLTGYAIKPDHDAVGRGARFCLNVVNHRVVGKSDDGGHDRHHPRIPERKSRRY